MSDPYPDLLDPPSGFRGVHRALRHAMSYPLAYPMDARDYTILTKREASVVASIGLSLMAMAQSFYITLWGKQ